MAKLKLTPTTNDQLQAASDGGLGQQFIAPTPMQPPLQLPNFPLPTKTKRGRKPKEQKVNTPQIVEVSEPKPLKIALVGTAPSSRMLAPYGDPSWTIWACSPGNMNVIPRFDAWFEVHGTNLWEPENKGYAPQYIKWMSELKVPLYMQDQLVCQNAISIPKDALVNEFGPYFFTSSFSWMMAMAIKAGAQEILLFGIDMASREEYIIQRPGAYYFFIEGAKRGVRMSAPYESDIMQPPGLYGYSDVTPFGRKLRARRDELKERVAPMEQQIKQMSDTVTYLKGALEDNDYTISIHMGAQDNSCGQQYLDAMVERSKRQVEEAKKVTLNPVALTMPSQG